MCLLEGAAFLVAVNIRRLWIRTLARLRVYSSMQHSLDECCPRPYPPPQPQDPPVCFRPTAIHSAARGKSMAARRRSLPVARWQLIHLALSLMSPVINAFSTAQLLTGARHAAFRYLLLGIGGACNISFFGSSSILSLVLLLQPQFFRRRAPR